MTNKLTKEDFMAHNNVHLCGKIIKKSSNSKELRVVLSCGHGKHMKKDKNGRFERNIVTVKFFGKAAEIYGTKYNAGDFVTVNAIAQTKKNPYTGDAHLEIWGLAMAPKIEEGKFIRDHNHVSIRGKVVSASVANNGLVVVNIFTNMEKKYLNPIKNDNVPFVTEKFRSITPVGIWCKGDAKEVVKQFTRGTWVDISGFADSKRIEKDNHIYIKQMIIALKAQVIGSTQIIQE